MKKYKIIMPILPGIMREARYKDQQKNIIPL